MNAKIYTGNIQPNPKEYKVWVNDEGVIKTWNGEGYKPIEGDGGGSNDDDFIYIDGNKLTPLDENGINIVEMLGLYFLQMNEGGTLPFPTFWAKEIGSGIDAIMPLTYYLGGSGFGEYERVYAVTKRIQFPLTARQGSGFYYPSIEFGSIDLKEWLLQFIDMAGMPEDQALIMHNAIDEMFTIAQITKEEFLNR